jgi:para-nitrobenzyl esterase
MLSYWTNFSKTGNPNGLDIPEWEIMNPSKDCWYELGEDMGTKAVNRLHIYSLINEMD